MANEMKEGFWCLFICLTRDSLSTLAYPKGPVQLSVLLPSLAHQLLSAFRASFPLPSRKDDDERRELFPSQPHAGRELHPAGAELLHGQSQCQHCSLRLCQKGCGGPAVLQQQGGPHSGDLQPHCTPASPATRAECSHGVRQRNWRHCQTQQAGSKC